MKSNALKNNGLTTTSRRSFLRLTAIDPHEERVVPARFAKYLIFDAHRRSPIR